MSIDVLRSQSEPVAVVIEVGSQIRKHVEAYFQKNEVRTIAWVDGLDADRIIQACRANMILLNMNLHDNKALFLCQQIKERTKIPVVMVSSTYTEVEKIVSLEMGADDCLPIDFNPRQLIARMRSSLGRQWSNVTVGDHVGGTGIRLNRALRQVQVGRDRVANLSPAEYQLLNFFVENPEAVFSREEIHSELFGQSSSHTFQAIDVTIFRVRKKIEVDYRRPKFLKTIRNRGYVLQLND